MIEDIIFETKGSNQCEIKLQHSTGETTTLLFNSTFPFVGALNATLQQFCFHYAIPPDIIIKLFLPEFHAAL